MKNTTLLLALTFATCCAKADIKPFSSNFTTKEALKGWATYIEGNPTAPPAVLLVGSGFGETGKPGTKQALRWDSQNEVPGDETLVYKLSGKMEENEIITVSGTAFNANNSHNNRWHVALVRDDGKVLAKSKNLGTDKTDGKKVKPVNFKITYTASAETKDVGAGASIVFSEMWDNPARDGFINDIKLTSERN